MSYALSSNLRKYIHEDIQDKFEFYNYGHALEILHDAFPVEWDEIQASLAALKITIEDILKAGGNESPMPKKFDDILYPYGWREIRISGDLEVKKYPRQAAQRRVKLHRDAEDLLTSPMKSKL